MSRDIEHTRPVRDREGRMSDFHRDEFWRYLTSYPGIAQQVIHSGTPAGSQVDHIVSTLPLCLVILLPFIRVLDGFVLGQRTTFYV